MQPERTFSIFQSTSLVIISLFQYITPPPHMLISRKSTVGRDLLLPSKLFKNPRGLADREAVCIWCPASQSFAERKFWGFYLPFSWAPFVKAPAEPTVVLHGGIPEHSLSDFTHIYLQSLFPRAKLHIIGGGPWRALSSLSVLCQNQFSPRIFTAHLQS